MTPYGDMELGQHCPKEWRVAWRHQAIIWTNAELSLMMCHGINLRALSLNDVNIPINKTRLKIAGLKWHPSLPGDNELKSEYLPSLVDTEMTFCGFLYLDKLRHDCTWRATCLLTAMWQWTAVVSIFCTLTVLLSFTHIRRCSSEIGYAIHWSNWFVQVTLVTGDIF